MSNLKIHSIGGKGDLANECVWLDVIDDITSLSRYLVCDTTYLDAAHISNELRHMYWFKNKAVKKGDWIKVMTKNGTDTTATNNRNTTTHIFYWKLGRTVWNKDGDAAILFHINTWNTLRS
jgi:hypothetical protein